MMKRVLSAVLLSFFIASCAMPPQRQDTQYLVGRALEAMGPAGAVASLQTMSLTGTARFWEPEQSREPGGEMRFANESTFELTRDFAAGATRVDWVRNFAYPAPRTFKFTEIVTPGAGYVIGVDSNGRNRQSLSMNPPAHAMSGLRLATTQRELARSSPWLLQEMRHNADKVSPAGDIVIGGVTYAAVRYNAGAHAFIIAFDPESGLPARIRTLDYDNVWGDVNYDLVFSDWRTAGGVRIPARQRYELNGRVVIDIAITGMTANSQVAAGRFEPPAAVKEGAAAPATGNVPYQWVLRRQFIGTYMDSDSVSWDTRASTGLRLNELAPGVQHQVGGTHNSLIVEMSDHLVVFDAPVSDAQSSWTIAAAKARYPNKPIRYLVLTHHHMDHCGGLRAYAAEGASLVVGKGAADHFRKVLSAPYRRDPDLRTIDLGGTRIMEVADRHVFDDGKRKVLAILFDNPHATASLMGYVEDARIAYVTDVYSPGGAPLPAKINPALASVVNAVRKAGIQPLTFAGGHGSTAPYAPLAGLAGK
jgi:glyoxylase-like metal-dependent hydrolase (beta-lactamase superfamily II)